MRLAPRSNTALSAVSCSCWPDSPPVLNMISEIALAMLACGAILAFVRLTRGPTLPDRVIAIDLIGVLIVCMLVVVASGRGGAVFLDVAIFIALISFVGTVAYARYVERER
jgi:multicomponent Na+:H+ antiporter subunit F